MKSNSIPRPSDNEKKAATRREKLEAFRYVPRLFKLIWLTHRGYTLAMIATRLTRGVVPIAMFWVIKLIMDHIVLMRASTPDYVTLTKLIFLEFTIVALGDILSRVSILVEALLAELFANHTSILVMKHAADLDLYHFEEPIFYDRLDRARSQTTKRIGFLGQIIDIGQDLITLSSLGIALVMYNPWLLFFLLASALPSFVGEARFASMRYSLAFHRTPQRRKLDYLRYLGTSDKAAKEVRIFGLAPWLIKRFQMLADQFYLTNKRLMTSNGVISAALSVISSIGYYAAYSFIIVQAATNVITLGALSFLSSSFMRSRDLIQRLLLSANGLYEQSLYIKDIFNFLEMKPQIKSRAGAPIVPRLLREGIVFENVSFRYPGSDYWAVKDICLHLRPGERVALVGENGAGKTTLTKLLARLYDPTRGRILLDGVDLREYNLDSVRKAVGAIFQDFVRYDLHFDENVGVGGIDHVQAYLDFMECKFDEKSDGSRQSVNPSDSVPHSMIISAAEKSLATSFLPDLPNGYRQMLGRRFDGGVDLSGGQWQKIALARAYMRDAQVLILDEPTSSFDARAEYEIFTQLSELIGGRISLLISHRFSTVRTAHRIIVFSHGAIVEEGTHNELITARGLYAELFAMQAAGYK